ncbi:MAG: hypothetical protein HY297_01940 [Thaumarchaeota archaeon]|nr:hypothetical protein [Nitrososphaerota archaeon]
MAKTVRVHDDTHEVLKLLKAQRRSASLDEVIREMVKSSTGVPVGKPRGMARTDRITSYLPD